MIRAQRGRHRQPVFTVLEGRRSAEQVTFLLVTFQVKMINLGKECWYYRAMQIVTLVKTRVG